MIFLRTSQLTVLCMRFQWAMSWPLSGAMVVIHGPMAAVHDAAHRANIYLDHVVSDSTSMLEELQKLQADAAAPGADRKALLASLEQLTAKAQTNHTNTVTFMDGVKACICTLLGSAETSGALASSLQDQVRNLSDRLLKVEHQMEADRSTILLGELAYTVDQAAVKYVFCSDTAYFQTIKQLEAAHVAGELSTDEAVRWKEFVTFVNSKSWSINRLVVVTKPLRELRKRVAHGEPQEKAGVTEAMLKDWAEKKLGQRSVQHIADLVKLVSCFTVPEQPLVCVQDVRVVIPGKAEGDTA